MAIKIAFCDFWGGFDTNPFDSSTNNFFYLMLREKFDIEISENPDVLIYSVFGEYHNRYNCKKVFYTGENIRPDLSSDYSISFDYSSDDRNFRFPLSAITLYENGNRDKFIKDIDFDLIKSEKVNFCNFLFSNPKGQARNYLFAELSKYKKIDAGGRVLNNIGYLVDNKLDFINNYKFTIAFENSEYPGYTTEKLVHPKFKNSIPIYWGNPNVSLDWNDKSFINAYNFSNMNQLIEYIKEVDNDDDLYYNMLMEKHFTNDIIPFNFNHNNLISFFENIFSNLAS